MTFAAIGGDHLRRDQHTAMLQDLAALTGGTAITNDLGLDLEKLTLADLGRAKRITVDKDATTIIEGRGNRAAIDARVKTLASLMLTTEALIAEHAPAGADRAPA